MSPPALSVAMSVYNGERFLDAAIQSVLAQSFGDFEFLILDDGSTDGSRELVRGYAARDPRIRLIARENRGLIASLNQLLEEARAPLVARMDADDISLPDRFARQVAFLEANPDHGVIGCWTRDIDENDAYFPIEGADHPLTHGALLETIPTGGPLLCHPGVIYRRDIVRSVGGYHAAFRHCEDYDLWLRLASVTRMANLPERLVLYRHYAGQVSNRHAIEQQTGAAVARMAWRERAAGRPDPTEDLSALPELDELDALFGIDGIGREVRGQIARSLLYSPVALRGAGFDIVLRHISEGGRGPDLWRTVPRLVAFGEPLRAARLAVALAKVA